MSNVCVAHYYGVSIFVDLDKNIFYTENPKLQNKSYHQLRKELKALIKFSKEDISAVDKAGRLYSLGVVEEHNGKAIVFNSDGAEVRYIRTLYKVNPTVLHALRELEKLENILKENELKC
jgi:predicted Zn-dependent protease